MQLTLLYLAEENNIYVVTALIIQQKAFELISEQKAVFVVRSPYCLK